MAVGDVYEVIDKQVLFGQEVLNVYQYRQEAVFATTLSNNAEALFGAWQSQRLPAILQVQTSDLTHTNITVRNLFNAADYYSEDISVVGAKGGDDQDCMSAFNAYSITTRGAGNVVRPGGKRIAGVSDAAVNDGVIVSNTYLSNLATISAGMESFITIGLIIPDPVFAPIIVKRVRSGVSGAYEYRLPENSGELVYAQIVNALVKVLVSSQVSRKIGVGA